MRLDIAEKMPKIQTNQNEDLIFWVRVKTSFENCQECICFKKNLEVVNILENVVKNVGPFGPIQMPGTS